MPLWIVPCTISSYVLAQYALFLNIITQRFNSINKTILKFGNMDSDDELSTIFTDKITLCKPIVNDIENVNHANLELCNICNKMADFYTFPMLITVIYFMILSMMNLYFLIGATITQSDELTLFDAIESGATVLVAVNCFVALNINVVRVESELEETASCVHLLMDRCLLNQEVEKSLIKFSWDLLHRNLGLSNYRIIELNGSFISSVFGTIVTNLILLFQFRPS
ncbi:GSCOCT00013871001.3-RA-CDS [Cotesia congregata]|uniref:Gustatory receptor 8.1 n=1 Tax=Cotesia congregata TaxID=51543 RepID=A0A8J2H7N0_COTCN|nr:GSCOCT00013871001.3-RA-CDS [Cotesia congregata]CAG5080887.1 gustatory receptor 8.1 [Cotesia congregata]